MPPRRTGGNVDIRQLVAGSTLFLPVEVEGGLFSVGDAHGAQGDGEVCVSAIEMASTVRLRFTVRHDLSIPEPQFRTPGNRLRHSSGSTYVTTAHGPDLMANSRQAVRYMLDHLEHEYGLSREDAYCLASAAIDLKISEIVDAPNWGRSRRPRLQPRQPRPHSRWNVPACSIQLSGTHATHQLEPCTVKPFTEIVDLGRELYNGMRDLGRSIGPFSRWVVRVNAVLVSG